MGGAVKAIAAPIEKSVRSIATSAGNVGEGIMSGDFSKTVKNVGYLAEEGAKAFSGVTSVKAVLGGAVRGLADITGATAAKEGLEAQIAQSQAESRRQALLSDELARSAGGEATKVSLNTKRNRLGINQSATGISGSASSRGTGVQQ